VRSKAGASKGNTAIAKGEVRERGNSTADHALDWTSKRKKTLMLWTIAAILIVLWLLGMISAYTIGGFIHILLVIAIIMILLRIIRGERPL
jgi:hypothetical protein